MNRISYQILYQQLHRPLVQYANNLIKDKDVAEDIVHDVFIKFLQCKSIENIDNHKSYLYRMTHNACLDYIRNNQSYKIIGLENVSSMYEEQINFDKLLSDNLQKKLAKEIDNLPPKCREIFKLNRYSGLSYLEIADRLSISHSTVKTQMAIAMHKLYEAMKKML